MRGSKGLWGKRRKLYTESWLGSYNGNALWSRTNKNRDVSTGPLARPFARSLAPLTRSLAPDCSLCSRPPLRSLVGSLAHFAHSLARGKVNFFMSQNDLVLSHSAPTALLVDLLGTSLLRKKGHFLFI